MMSSIVPSSSPLRLTTLSPSSVSAAMISGPGPLVLSSPPMMRAPCWPGGLLRVLSVYFTYPSAMASPLASAGRLVASVLLALQLLAAARALHRVGLRIGATRVLFDSIASLLILVRIHFLA